MVIFIFKKISQETDVLWERKEEFRGLEVSKKTSPVPT